MKATEIIRAAEACRTSCTERLKAAEENVAYSASFNDGEHRVARKVAQEAKRFCDYMKPLCDLILEDDKHAPG
jgi:hypothetical protein